MVFSDHPTGPRPEPTTHAAESSASALPDRALSASEPASASTVPRLRRSELVRVEAMIRSNLVQDLTVQVILVVVGALWFSNRWIWALWGVRWIVLVAIGLALGAIKRGRRSQSLLLLATGHVVGVVGLVAIAPVLVPLGMLILVGDLFLGSYLHESIRTRYLITMVAVTAGVAALSFQSWTDLADRTPRTVALALIIGHTFASGFLVPRVHREHYVTLSRARDRLTASEQRVASAVQAERMRIAANLEGDPLLHIDRLLSMVNEIRKGSEVGPKSVGDPSTDADSRTPSELATAGASQAQEALRSLRRISHGVYPELLQSGLHTALRPLLGSIGTVERFDVPTTRWAGEVEAAVYMALRELTEVNVGPGSTNSTVIAESANRVEVFVRLTDVVPGPGPSIPPMAADRIAAVGGESDLRIEGTSVEFLASLPFTTPAPMQTTGVERRVAPRATVNDRTELDANFSILAVFTMWGFRVAMIGVAASTLVLAATRDPSGILVVAALSWLAIGALLGARFARRREYGISITAMCVVTSSSAVILTALVTELSPTMALVVSLPTTLAVPFLSERYLDRIALVQAAALSAVSVLGYRDVPLIKPVVPMIVPAIIVPLAAAAVATIITLTLVGTVRTVTNASAQVRATLATIVHTADAQRQSIERDLHDGAQQLFVAISIQFRTLAKVLQTDTTRAIKVLATIEELLGQARVTLVSVAHGALVPELEEGRLADALRGRLAAFGSDVTLHTTGVESVHPDLATAIYFCCHEALQNAMKHGGPGVGVAVSVHASEDQVQFSVTDNGFGFDTSQARPGNGLASLQQRVGELNGTLAVTSTLGLGTTVGGTFPLRM